MGITLPIVGVFLIDNDTFLEFDEHGAFDDAIRVERSLIRNFRAAMGST
jgi:hypothetical protein